MRTSASDALTAYVLLVASTSQSYGINDLALKCFVYTQDA
jgi:hypothetical protein